MHSFLIEDERDPVCLTDYPMVTIRQLAEMGRPLYWDHRGFKRKIPNSVLRDTLWTMEAHDAFYNRHPEAEAPSWYGKIRLEQTVSPKGPSADEATLLPRLPPSQPHPSASR